MQKFYLRTILLCSWLSFTGILAAQQAASLTPRLQAKMAQSAPNAYIRTLVSMRAQADIEALETKFADMQKLTPEQRSFEVITALQNVARNTQGALSAELDAAKNTGEVKSYEKFWVVNLFMIEARKDFIQSLTQHAEIDYIDLDGELKLEKFKVEKMDGPLSNTSVGGIEPGLCAINVRPLWKLGYTGCGRKVMGIDTGVDGTHPALSARWAGNSVPSAQAWLDQMTSPLTTTPTDCDGHGTHTMGTMIGLDPATSDTVGVAIGATWMAAQTICSSPHTSYSIAAFQWAMDPDGNAGTVNDRPDAINNSWYDPDVTSCDITYQNLFTNVEAAGIAVVFSAGNSGSGASTITNPKNINTSLVNTFCVANVSVPTCTTAPTIASSSSRGPSTCGGTGSLLIKPEVSAPGTDVRSSYVGGGYSFLTGTSMAAPHVAGAIALLKEAFPSLTGTQIKLALYNTCTDLGAAGEDNTYGMGMINVLAAYNYLKTNHLSAWSPPCENVCSGVTYLYGCSGTFTDGSGPGLPYANNANCSWYIVGAGSLNTPITLTFDSLDIEYGYDSIYVYDGPNSSSPLLATITGTTIPAPIVSSTYDMFVRFKSDFTVTRPGFQARYSSAPLKPTITGPSSTCVGTIGVLNGASCGNCNYTYSWTGGFTGPTRVVAATGSYTVTATNSCGSTASNPFAFTINPLPPANAGVDKTICNGGSTVIGSTAQSGVSYMWSPTTGLSNSNIATPTASPTTTTTYIVTAFRTSTGCYKTDTVKVTVLATPTANAGADKTICAGTSTTIGTAAVAGTTYSWTPSTGLSSATAAMPTANPTTTTTYNLVATLTATGCAKSDAVVVTVNALPTANAGVDKTICAGSSTTIGSAAISGTTYLWSPTTALSSATAANPTATPTVTTTYIVTATKTLGGCTKKDTVVVTVNPLPTANAGVDKSICVGTSTTIGSAAVAGMTYSWAPSTGLSSPTAAMPTANPSTTTTYTLTVTHTATGCTKTDAVVVTVNALPTANAGVDKTICAGSSTTIGSAAISGTTYLWSPTTALSSATAANPTATPTVTTTYIVTATKTLGGCTKKDTVKVTVNPLPNATAGVDKSVCAGSAVVIGTSSSTAGVTYQWTPPTGLSSTTVTNPMASPTTTTTYTVTALNTATGCAKSDAVVVTVNPLPTANAGLDKTLCAGGSTTIGTTGTSGFTYTWSPTTGLSSAFVAIPTATPSATTTYTLTVKNSTSLCTKTDAVLVTVNPLPGANAGTDKTIVSGSSVIIGTTAVAGRSYNWSPATALSSPTSAQPAASPLQTTNYTLTVTMVATGCTSTDQVVVNVTSPNEGGITDGTDEVVKEMQSSLGFKVFPNPVSNVLNITSEMAMRSHVKVMMYNQVGQLIHEQIVNLDNQSLDVQLPTSELAHGIYTIQISTAQTLETYKVVKE